MADIDSGRSPRGQRRAGLMGNLIFLGKVALAAYVTLAVLAYFYQDVLIFLPQQRSTSELQSIASQYPSVQTVSLPVDGGVTLQGWLYRVPETASSPAPLLVYYGGNAEEVSWLLGMADRFAGYSLLLMNYRGYGGSTGKPGEQALLSDALRVFDYAVSLAGGDEARVAIMGRSLGTGMAVHVAARRAPRAVVLVSPYDSMVELGWRHHPYLPVSLLLRHRFESQEDAPQAKAPLLVIVATLDSIVPPEHSRRLIGAWGGASTWREIDGANHHNISSVPAYWQSIAAFLTQMRGH